MPDIYDIAKEFKRNLRMHEQAASDAMTSAYGEAWQRIKADLDVLTRQIADAQKSGSPVTVSWLFKEERLQSLLRQVEFQINGVARFASYSIEFEQRKAVNAAGSNALQSILFKLEATNSAPRIVSDWNYLPTPALEHLIGTLSDGSPLHDLFDTFGYEASAKARSALITGVATGAGPRQIARSLHSITGESLTRTLTIARTETMRSYNSASLANYRANSDVVKGWQWEAELSSRTCAMCVSMHGTEHSLDEPFSSHQNCRCTPMPITLSYAELGISGVPEPTEDAETGDEWFARQDDEKQRTILGVGKYELYSEGKIELADVVGTKDDARWGRSRYEKPLKELVTK